MLTLVFENCESVDIDPNDIQYMNIWGVTESISFSKRKSETEVHKYSEGFNLGVRKASTELVERVLQYKDITQVYWEGELYFMNWKDHSLDESEYQTSHFDSDAGMLHINISKDEEI